MPRRRRFGAPAPTRDNLAQLQGGRPLTPNDEQTFNQLDPATPLPPAPGISALSGRDSYRDSSRFLDVAGPSPQQHQLQGLERDANRGQSQRDDLTMFGLSSLGPMPKLERPMVTAKQALAPLERMPPRILSNPGGPPPRAVTHLSAPGLPELPGEIGMQPPASMGSSFEGTVGGRPSNIGFKGKDFNVDDQIEEIRNMIPAERRGPPPSTEEMYGTYPDDLSTAIAKRGGTEYGAQIPTDDWFPQQPQEQMVTNPGGPPGIDTQISQINSMIKPKTPDDLLFQLSSHPDPAQLLKQTDPKLVSRVMNQLPDDLLMEFLSSGAF